MAPLGDRRDCTKFQILIATSPTADEDIFIFCYHCNCPIIREDGTHYVMVAGAYQRPIYFHDDDCYEQFTSVMNLFYQEILVPIQTGAVELDLS